MPAPFDLYVGLITSDFQVRIRGGKYMGFENQWWDRSNWPSLVAPNMRVDVNHRRRVDPTCLSAFMLELCAETRTTSAFRRTGKNLAQWIMCWLLFSFLTALLLIKAARPNFNVRVRLA